MLAGRISRQLRSRYGWMETKGPELKHQFATGKVLTRHIHLPHVQYISRPTHSHAPVASPPNALRAAATTSPNLIHAIGLDWMRCEIAHIAVEFHRTRWAPALPCVPAAETGVVKSLWPVPPTTTSRVRNARGPGPQLLFKLDVSRSRRPKNRWSIDLKISPAVPVLLTAATTCGFE